MEKCREKDEKAIDTLILKYKNLVKSIVRKYFLVGADMDDLMQEGMMGLYKAILSFDDSANYKFESYAKLCISRQVYNAIKQANSKRNQALNTSVFLGGQGELGEECIDDDEDNMIVVALEEENPESIAIKKEQLKNFYESIDRLLDRKEHEILQMYLNGDSYVDMANKLNITTKNVDNILTRIRTKLKKENL